MDAKDLDILMVVLTTVSLGIPFCVDFVCIDLGMRKEAERLGALRLSNDMISSWMRLKEKRDLHLILVECLLKMKSPLEVKRRTKKIKLKNSESVSKNCCV